MYRIPKRWRDGRAAGRIVGTTLISAAVALVVATGAIAASGIILQLDDAPLKDVVMLLSQQSGANIVIADESSLDKRITVNLNGVSLEKALTYVVKCAGVAFHKMADGTYIIGGRDGLADHEAPTTVQAPLPATISPAPAPKEVRVVKIMLTHSTPSELLRLINGCPTESFDMGQPSMPVPNNGNGTEGNSRGGVYYTSQTNGQAGAPNAASRPQPNSQPVLPTIDPTAMNTGSGRTADVNTGAAQYPAASTRSGYNPNTPNNPSNKPGTTNNTNQNFLWPDGVQNAVPFDLDNSILVKGDEDGIEKFKKIVRMLDVPPKQVSIKAEFVEVDTNQVKNFGIDWSLKTINASFNTAFGPTGNVIIGLATGNLTAQMEAQLTNDVGRLINSPIISTINNQMAYISISTVIPYWISMATVVGTGNSIIQQSTPQFITVETFLDVMPRVNGDGTITMTLSPQIADTGNNVTGPNGEVIPEQTEQTLYTQRRVGNGETIVVGGFIRKNDSDSVQKIPILGDLPIVGSLFRTTAKSLQDSELLIFVTPTIIPDPTGATVGTSLVP